MRPEVVEQLLALNRAFYESLAAPFARSRAAPQPGFDRLLAALPQPCPRLLDVGCGSGRFGAFLLARQAIGAYAGVDFSQALLAQARTAVPGDYVQAELSQPGCLDPLGRFEAIACLATLQHIPGGHNRQRLLAGMAAHLQPGGRILLANWQFLGSERQRRKVRPWSDVGLAAADVEANDYLLTWQRGGFAYRYICLLDATATAVLAAAAGLEIVDQFRSDGREGNLNLYTILRQGRPVDSPGANATILIGGK